MYIFKVSFSCSDKEIDLWIELLIWKQLVLAQFMGHRFESNKKKMHGRRKFSHFGENHV